jgi:hypothetical protein
VFNADSPLSTALVAGDGIFSNELTNAKLFLLFFASAMDNPTPLTPILLLPLLLLHMRLMLPLRFLLCVLTLVSPEECKIRIVFFVPVPL